MESNKRVSIIDRLNDNYIKVIVNLSLPLNERKSLGLYLQLTLQFGLDNHDKAIENAYFVDLVNRDNFCKHIIGEPYRVVIPEDDSNEIAATKASTLTTFHNHPDSFAPSDDDYKLFLRHGSIINMAVCGHSGNLYFLRKSIPFHTGMKEYATEFLDKFKKTTIQMFYDYRIKRGYTVEQVTENRELTKECVTAVMDEFFDAFCARLDKFEFKYYREGMM